MNFGTAGPIGEIARLLAALALIGGTSYAVWRRERRRPRVAIVSDGPDDEPYRIFTRDYDLELAAAEVSARLPVASPDGARGSYQRDHALWPACITNLEALLAEQDEAGWGEALAAARAAAAGLPDGALTVTLLIDQSGSMKGVRIARAAMLATRLTALLGAIGVSSEVLGFTTAGWRGGHALAAWVDAGRPPRPGRLCALMHVVYKTPDEAALSEAARNLMLDPALLRENIDGEAVLWAWSRLQVRPEPHKLLIVVSDGAPVDDATLTYNAPSILWRHLTGVLAALAAEPSLTLGGIGLDHWVERLYPLSERIGDPDDLPGAAGRLLAAMIAKARG
jgi:cobaltochelatase CobT